MHILILAGGSGTRLWPLSRENFPKQFLKIGDPLSLLQKTIRRFESFATQDRLVIITNIEHHSLVFMQLQEIGMDHIPVILEPVSRNTTAAIGLGLRYLEERRGLLPNEPVLVTPSDHHIEPESVFLHALEQTEPLVKEDIVLFGIYPTHPEEGYGYIEVGKKTGETLYRVERFIEKPSQALAASYLASKNYYWNSGMFLFSAETFWRELSLYRPDIAILLHHPFELVKSFFYLLPSISIDYAILEKTGCATVAPLAVRWSDVGSWQSVYETLPKDGHLNAQIGEGMHLDTYRSLIVGGKKLIATIGLEDMMIIDTEDVLLIGKKGDSQRVRELVQEWRRISPLENALPAKTYTIRKK